MDRREDAELMMSYDGMRKIANAHLKMIERALSDEPKKVPKKRIRKAKKPNK